MLPPRTVRTRRPRSQVSLFPVKESVQTVEYSRLVLEFDERVQILKHLCPVEPGSLPDENAFDVNPVLIAIGEGLVHDEIFRRASEQCVVGIKPPWGRSIDGVLLERKSPKSDIESHAIGGGEQEDAIPERKSTRVIHTRLEFPEEGIDKAFFIPKSGDHGQIGIVRVSILPPSLERHSANDAETIALLLAEALHLERRLEHAVFHVIRRSAADAVF